MPPAREQPEAERENHQQQHGDAGHERAPAFEKDELARVVAIRVHHHDWFPPRSAGSRLEQALELFFDDRFGQRGHDFPHYLLDHLPRQREHGLYLSVI